LPSSNDTDKEWETWGKVNPYFGVLSVPKYLAENLNDKTLEEFYWSGEHHIEHVFDVISEKILPNFQPARSLDYGCGVGRLVIPLAKRSQEIVGIDVSPSMLEKAREACDKFGATSVQLLLADKLDSLPPASFDLVHSYIVFQHIPLARGEAILKKMIALLADGGIGAIQIPYRNAKATMHRKAAELRHRSSLVNGLLNLVGGRPLSSPRMQMNLYSLECVLEMLVEAKCSNVHLEFSNHGDIHGVMLYFQRKKPKWVY